MSFSTDIWKDVEQIRSNGPLIHNITNFVVMNNTANALLAIGASPVMAHSIDEVEEMVGIAGALVVNIGTLDAVWIDSMLKAMKAAKQRNTPIILDPVGAGATRLRTNTAHMLIKEATPDIIRGNASEILALATEAGATKGVDSSHESEAAVDSARELSQRFGCVVSVSGATDFVIRQNDALIIKNGHPMMSKVTGLGCTAAALAGAFSAVNQNSFHAAAHAMAVQGIAGEMAAEKSPGPGSLQLHLLDALYQITEEDIQQRLKMEQE